MNRTLKTNIVERMAEAGTAPDVARTVAGIQANPDADLFSLLIYPETLPLAEELKASVINLIRKEWTAAFSTVSISGLIFIAAGVVVALFVGNKKIKRGPRQFAPGGTATPLQESSSSNRPADGPRT